MIRLIWYVPHKQTRMKLSPLSTRTHLTLMMALASMSACLGACDPNSTPPTVMASATPAPGSTVLSTQSVRPDGEAGQGLTIAVVSPSHTPVRCLPLAVYGPTGQPQFGCTSEAGTLDLPVADWEGAEISVRIVPFDRSEKTRCPCNPQQLTIDERTTGLAVPDTLRVVVTQGKITLKLTPAKPLHVRLLTSVKGLTSSELQILSNSWRTGTVDVTPSADSGGYSITLDNAPMDLPETYFLEVAGQSLRFENEATTQLRPILVKDSSAEPRVELTISGERKGTYDGPYDFFYAVHRASRTVWQLESEVTPSSPARRFCLDISSPPRTASLPEGEYWIIDDRPDGRQRAHALAGDQNDNGKGLPTFTVTAKGDPVHISLTPLS